MLKRSRIFVLAFLVFAIIVCYSYQLMQYQVTNGASYRTQADNTTTGDITVPAPRGEILDRYGRVLATNKIGYSLIIEQNFFPPAKEAKQQNDEFLQLTAIVGQNGGQWEDSLPISRTTPYAYQGASKADVKTLVKNINSVLVKGQKKLPDNASAAAVIDALKTIYKTSGYTEAQQRTLCGIRYEMQTQSFTYTNIFTFAQNVDINAVTQIEERSLTLPGIIVQQVPYRTYVNGAVAPGVVGITGPIQQSQLADYTKMGYSPEDIIGHGGVEQTEEQYLRGVSGVEQIEVNSNGDVANTPKMITPTKPGDNVVLTIDEDLQVNLQNELKTVIQQIKEAAKTTPGHPGADAQGASAVVLDVKTGEVLALANYPSYDLNTYRQDFSQLNNDPLHPLINRAIYSGYTPGSTFKPIVATAGLMDGIITPETKWNVPAEFTVGTGTGYTIHDDSFQAHGGLDVQHALAISSNVFFGELGNDLKIDKIDKAAQIFGIGEKTGIELPGESPGILSGRQEKQNRDGLPWYPGDTLQASIGQMETLITPLQLANYVSTLVKGGTQYQVHVVQQINNNDNTKVLVNNTKPTIKSKTVIPADVINTVKEGMGDVTEGNGTAAAVFGDFKLKVGGKTGTAQITTTKYNGVFISFAPFDDPEIAVAVVVEYGHNGFQTAPAAKTAMQQYFSLDQYGNSIVPTAPTTSTGTLLQ